MQESGYIKMSFKNRIRIFTIFIAILSSLIASDACRKQQKPWNLVLITIDTLRADHLTPYGYQRDTSPFLNQLADESFLFKDVVSQCGTTAQSLSSLMTGLYPYTDQIILQNGPIVFLKKKNLTLARILQQKGYRTHAITSSIQSAPVTGINLGFETFDAIEVNAVLDKSNRRTAEQITRLAVDWLRKRSHDKPFFLWLHYLDPHYPYSPPEAYTRFFKQEKPAEEGDKKYYRFDEMHSENYPLSDGEVERLIINYDREIRYTDTSLEALFQNGLKPLLANTVVIVTADHGESLGNHFIITHNELYQSILHIPLLIHLPDKAHPKGVIKNPVMLLDIFPTVLDLLGIPSEFPVRGKSLKSLLFAKPEEGKRDQRFRMAEYHDRKAFLLEKMKMIDRGSRRELYDLEKDPYEFRDLSGTMQDDQDKLFAEALRIKKDAAVYDRSNIEALPQVTPEMRDELKSLGYVTK